MPVKNRTMRPPGTITTHANDAANYLSPLDMQQRGRQATQEQEIYELEGTPVATKSEVPFFELGGTSIKWDPPVTPAINNGSPSSRSKSNTGSNVQSAAVELPAERLSSASDLSSIPAELPGSEVSSIVESPRSSLRNLYQSYSSLRSSRRATSLDSMAATNPHGPVDPHEYLDEETQRSTRNSLPSRGIPRSPAFQNMNLLGRSVQQLSSFQQPSSSGNVTTGPAANGSLHSNDETLVNESTIIARSRSSVIFEGTGNLTNARYSLPTIIVDRPSRDSSPVPYDPHRGWARRLPNYEGLDWN